MPQEITPNSVVTELANSVADAQSGKLSKDERKTLLSQAKDTARMVLISRVAQDFGPIVEAQADAAKGIWEEKEVTDPSDHTKKILRVYKRPPNTDAGQYLINQVVGKPIETVENDQSITINFGPRQKTEAPINGS